MALAQKGVKKCLLRNQGKNLEKKNRKIAVERKTAHITHFEFLRFKNINKVKIFYKKILKIL